MFLGGSSLNSLLRLPPVPRTSVIEMAGQTGLCLLKYRYVPKLSCCLSSLCRYLNSKVKWIQTSYYLDFLLQCIHSSRSLPSEIQVIQNFSLVYLKRLSIQKSNECKTSCFIDFQEIFLCTKLSYHNCSKTNIP